MIVINDEVSKRIHALRFLLVVFVVIIHNGISEDAFAGRNIAVEIPLYVKKVQEFIDIITRVAVPMFFFISAFLLYAKENAFTPVLKKRSRTILVPYLLWTALFVLLYFTMQTLPFTRDFFMTDPEHLIRNYGPLDWIDVFWGKITYRNESGHPFVFQFWFLRDLFLLDLLFIPLKRLIDRFPFGAFVLFFILWIGKVNIYLVSPEALFFFALGCYIVKYRLSEKAIDAIKLPDITCVYLITLLTELFGNIPIIHNINILLGCAFFIRLSGLAVRNAKLYRVLTWLEQYEFIVYAVHAIIISQLLKIIIKLLPVHGGFLLAEYLGVVTVSIALCVVFGAVFKRLFPKPFAVLTGGR
jgi:fucose 4-O-acetylase-like acetyltransferase